jgi:predicted DNA-binding transcriptional regulator
MIFLRRSIPKLQERIDSLKIRISNIKKKLVFLSTKARDKVTKFYASNALKEIAQKLKEK